MSQHRSITTKADLLAAIADQVEKIEISGKISALNSITLHPGQSLWGHGENAVLEFQPGQDGVFLTTDCKVHNLTLNTDIAKIALGLVDDGKDFGQIEIKNLTTVGRIHLEAQSSMHGVFSLTDVHVARADARETGNRPAGFGVQVLLGGLSIYNSSRNPDSLWTVQAHNLSGGSADDPLQGSGIFIFGGNYIAPGTDMTTTPGPDAKGGQIIISTLSTGAVYTNGHIPKGVGNFITGGVFVGSGAKAAQVLNKGEVTTWGGNDMVLDNWGEVDLWHVVAKVESFGPSGIGFVNFGGLRKLVVEAPILTHGLGARGFNLYDGTLGYAQFETITTYGDGAIGIQVSKPFDTISVSGNVETYGGTGDSLVRGKVVTLKAHALSLKPGAAGAKLEIKGQALAHHSDIPALELLSQEVKALSINGETLA